MQITLDDITSASRIVYSDMQATPQYRWPLLCERLGVEVWVKHENHTPVGAFKIRGGLVYFHHLMQSDDVPTGVISATRGNHGQSIGHAARRYDLPVTIVVPHGNSIEKNAAMQALGVKLIEQGDDFQESREFAVAYGKKHSLHMVPAFHPWLVTGVATYSLELFRAVSDIDVAYVPIGLGSGICGMMAARDALNLKTRIVGVVSAHASAYAKSFVEGRAVDSPVTTLLSDGMACRTPEPAALELILKGVDRIVQVTDEEVSAAMRMMFEWTHNVCEGAGAAALAAATKEAAQQTGHKVAVVATGGNVDQDVFANVLNKTC
jgi:threonine dehydratase